MTKVSYTLYLADATQPFTPSDDGGPISIGQSYSGSLSNGDLDQWSFFAKKGDYLLFTYAQNSPNNSISAVATVYNPDGTAFPESGLCDPCNGQAQQTGIYQVVMSRLDELFDRTDETVSYSFKVARAPDVFGGVGGAGGIMLSGNTYSGTLTNGDNNQWSFHATAGNPIQVLMNSTGPAGYYSGYLVIDQNGEVFFHDAGYTYHAGLTGNLLGSAVPHR